MDLLGPLVSHYKVKGIAKSDLDPFVKMSFVLENSSVDNQREISGTHMSPRLLPIQVQNNVEDEG